MRIINLFQSLTPTFEIMNGYRMACQMFFAGQGRRSGPKGGGGGAEAGGRGRGKWGVGVTKSTPVNCKECAS